MKKGDWVSTYQILSSRLCIEANWMYYSRTCQYSHHEKISSYYSALPDQTSFKVSLQFELQKGTSKASIIEYRKNQAFKMTNLCKINSEINWIENTRQHWWKLYYQDNYRKYLWPEKGKAWSITNITFRRSTNVISEVKTKVV